MKQSLRMVAIAVPVGTLAGFFEAVGASLACFVAMGCYMSNRML